MKNKFTKELLLVGYNPCAGVIKNVEVPSSNPVKFFFFLNYNFVTRRYEIRVVYVPIQQLCVCVFMDPVVQ